MITEALRGVLESLVAANAVVEERIKALLALARAIEPGDREGAGVLLEAAQFVGEGEQARHGQLIQLLGQVDRVRAHRAGVKAWVAAHLDVSEGKARGIAQAARRIGALPELAESLSSGRVGADTVRVLSRTVKAVEGSGQDQAVELAATLETAKCEGVGAASRRVRVLEHTIDPGSSEELLARRRAKCFVRVVELEGGMCRFDILLDPVRATLLRAALDQTVADWIRRRQFDGVDSIPLDVRSTEQMCAQAVTRLAEVYLAASPQQRGAQFPTEILYTAPLDTDEPATSVYGALVPRTAIPAQRAHLLQTRDGEPVLLDGEEIDRDPGARLASAAQRVALAFRDRHCTYPGCTRPPTWSLHAHHKVPYRQGGATTVKNLSLLCSEHHTLTHHPES
jgi:Domain of unknown function (DUF222)/HNH endonuclease